MHAEEPRPSPDDLGRAARALGGTPVAWRPVTRGGQTAASRWIATLPDGSTRFVKIAYTLDTAAWIRDERLFYVQHIGLPFLPRTLGWDDDGERPVLVLEDLSDAVWPPPWDRGWVQAVLDGLTQVADATISPEIPRVGAGQFDREGWPEVAAHREAVLALGLCGGDWLDACLSTLTETAHAAPLEGDRLLHMDVRSDNLCLRDDGVRFVDWNFACRGTRGSTWRRGSRASRPREARPPSRSCRRLPTWRPSRRCWPATSPRTPPGRRSQRRPTSAGCS